MMGKTNKKHAGRYEPKAGTEPTAMTPKTSRMKSC